MKKVMDAITYDTKIVNEVLKKVNEDISLKILELEEGKIEKYDLATSLKIGSLTEKKQGVVYEIPFGSLRNSTLFAHLGPTIPIKMNFIGQINSNIKTKIKEYGINSLSIELFVESEIKARATMPISTKNEIIKTEAPITIQIVQGKIPSYYFDNIEKNSQKVINTLN